MAQLNATHKGGGVVAVDPASGAVLVLASAPIYNPNDFTLGFTQNELDRFNALDLIGRRSNRGAVGALRHCGGELVGEVGHGPPGARVAARMV